MVNNLKTALLMGALFGLFLFLGELWGGPRGALWALVLALITNLAAYWFSDRIILGLYRAQEVDEFSAPQLVRLVRELALRAGLPMPRVYIIPHPTPNAFATGRGPSHAAVAVTEGLLRLMNEEELRGVLGHELAHVKNRDILISTIAAALAGAITLLVRMAYWASWFGWGRDDEERGHPLVALLMLILAPLAALIIQLAISRSREYKADADGARMTGNPLGLAEALRKLAWAVEQRPMAEANPATAHMFIVHPFRGEGLLTLFSTHPPIEERIARLEAMARGHWG